jgi:hypothetical protein
VRRPARGSRSPADQPRRAWPPATAASALTKATAARVDGPRRLRPLAGATRNAARTRGAGGGPGLARRGSTGSGAAGLAQAQARGLVRRMVVPGARHLARRMAVPEVRVWLDAGPGRGRGRPQARRFGSPQGGCPGVRHLARRGGAEPGAAGLARPGVWLGPGFGSARGFGGRGVRARLVPGG